MRGAVEEPLTAADRSLGGATQGFARCVEAESVKKVQLRVKKVRPRAPTDQPEKRQGPKEGPETEFEKPGHVGFWTKRVLR